MTRNVSSAFVDASNLISFSVAHFVVDFACAFLLFRMEGLNAISYQHAALLFVAYNALAFGLEVLIGSFCTARNQWRISITGVALVALALVIGWKISSLFSANHQDLATSSVEAGLAHIATSTNSSRGLLLWLSLASVLAGIGNASFHVGGGVDSLSRNIGKYWRSGVFISTGSLGIALGVIAGGNPDSFSFARVFGLLAFCTVLLFASSLIARVETSETRTDFPQVAEPFDNRPILLFVTSCALYVIFVRSALGFFAPVEFQIRTDILTNGLALATGAFLGKFVGGFLADFISARAIGSLALILSIPALIFSDSFVVFWFGVFFLNTTTSITLVSTAQGCRGRNGFAFGLTTLALLIGFFFFSAIRGASFLREHETFIQVVNVLILLSSAIALFLSTRKSHPNVD